jgi:hypothetical protein
VLSNGDDSRNIPAKWNSLTGTGGIGWDFNLYTDRWGGTLVLRPIFNFMLGTMASDVRIGSRLIEQKRNADFNFLTVDGSMPYGLGGSLMLDYELFSKEQDIDVELRYSGMSLQTFGSTPEAVSGQSSAENIGLYLRRRAPISDWTLLKSPVRYVLEGAHNIWAISAGSLGLTVLVLWGRAGARQQPVSRVHQPHASRRPLYVRG